MARVRGNTPFPILGLTVLSAAIFVSMTTEFIVGGLIPYIAADFGRPVGVVGQLVTVFAATVVVTTLPLSIVTRKVSRKFIVLVAFSVIAIANIISVVAPSFEVLLAARVIGGAAHGLFWSVVAAYSAHLVTPQQLGRATALTAAGGSIATLAGLPIGNAIGLALGWRSAFTFLVLLSLAVLALLGAFLPAIRHHLQDAQFDSVSAPRRDRSLGPVLLVCVLIVLIVLGQSAFGTYLAVWLPEAAGVAAAAVPAVLLLTGVAGAVGLILKGLTADRYPRSSLMVGLIMMALSLTALPAVAPLAGSLIAVVVLLLWSMAFGGVPALLQALTMRTASLRMRGLAGALQTTAFNVGIGGGALVGGVAIDSLGVAALPSVAGSIIMLAIVGALATYATSRRRDPMDPQPGDAA